MTSPPLERFHLTVYAAGRPVMHGWWRQEVTARDKFTSWVGSWGRRGVRVTLVDEQDGAVLKTWDET